MAAPALLDLRAGIQLDPDAQVRICFEGDQRIPVFECFPCVELLQWNEERRWWYCPVCGYEMTPPEADMLLEWSMLRLQVRQMDVLRKRGMGKWHAILRLLGRVWSLLFGRS